jgi:hypothetical protein
MALGFCARLGVETEATAKTIAAIWRVFIEEPFLIRSPGRLRLFEE